MWELAKGGPVDVAVGVAVAVVVFGFGYTIRKRQKILWSVVGEILYFLLLMSKLSCYFVTHWQSYNDKM